MWRLGPLAAAALAAVAACGVIELPRTDDQDAAVVGGRLELSDGARIAYLGTFDWEDAFLSNGSYTFANDLGVGFRIDLFQLATKSVQLRVCEEAEDDQTTSWWPSSTLRWGVPSAYADHVVEDDSSIAIVDRAENALATSISELAVGTASGGAYCQAFLLSSVLSEADPDLDGHTIAIAGAYVLPGDDASNEANWVPFDARVPLGDGMLEELAAASDSLPSAALGNDIDVDVLITRYPVRAFQSLDPRDFDAAELAWEVLGNVLHGATVSVRLP